MREGQKALLTPFEYIRLLELLVRDKIYGKLERLQYRFLRTTPSMNTHNERQKENT